MFCQSRDFCQNFLGKIGARGFTILGGNFQFLPCSSHFLFIAFYFVPFPLHFWLASFHFGLILFPYIFDWFRFIFDWTPCMCDWFPFIFNYCPFVFDWFSFHFFLFPFYFAFLYPPLVPFLTLGVCGTHLTWVQLTYSQCFRGFTIAGHIFPSISIAFPFISFVFSFISFHFLPFSFEAVTLWSPSLAPYPLTLWFDFFFERASP